MKRYACYRKIHCTFTFLFLKPTSKEVTTGCCFKFFFTVMWLFLPFATVPGYLKKLWMFFLTGLHTKKLLVKCTQILWLVRNTAITRHLWFLPGFLQNLGMGENNYHEIDCMWSGLSWRNGLQKKWDLKWEKIYMEEWNVWDSRN